MHSVIQDLRYAVRGFVRTPGFTAVVVGSIAMGITATTTIFSVVNAVMFRGLPVHEPDELVNVYATQGGAGSFLLSYSEYTRIRDREGVFSSVAAHGMTDFSVTIDGPPETATGEVVTGNYFSVLGVRPALGRAFLPEDDGSSPAAILSNSYWRRRFAADPDAVGATIHINGQSFRVIGIGPRGFTGTFTGVGLDLWVSTAVFDLVMPPSDSLQSQASRRLDVTGRLKPGLGLAHARAAIIAYNQLVAQDLPRTYGEGARGFTVASAKGVRPGVRGVLAGFLAAMMGIVTIVLLIACTNVAGLLLLRASMRQREIAVRQAIGAGRSRLVRQLLTESLVLGVCGGALGLALTLVTTQGFAALALANVTVPIHFNLRPDLTVLAFTALVSVFASVVFGSAPALYSARTDLVTTLKEGVGRAGAGRSRMRGGLVVVQIALSLVLLIGAGLFLRSMRAAGRADPGFRTAGLAIASIEPDRLRYDEPRGRALLADVLERARREPGVQHAALARFVPLASQSDQRDISIGGADAAGSLRSRVYYNVVGPDYFDTMGIPILRGRDMRDTDRAGSRGVVVINEAMAEQFWPEEDPLGRRLRFASGTPDAPLEVVGIVQDIKYRSTTEGPRPYMYLPFSQHYRGLMTLHVRTAGDAVGSLGNILEAARGLEPNLPTDQVGRITEAMGSHLTGRRLISGVLAAAGVVALLLATVGLYGVVAYAVNNRVHEFGIRMALGARTGDVRRFVLLHGLRLCGAGLAVGLVLTVGITRVITSALYGVTPTDPVTYLGVSLFMAVVALLATYLPSRRATRVDPVTALRAD